MSWLERMLLVTLAVLAMSCGGPRRLHEPAAPAGLGVVDADRAWADLNRALQGQWQAVTGDKRTVRTSYRTVSKGSALVETFTTASGTETLTVFHRDGAALVLTHYCAQGNQARLVATAATPQRVVFELAGATNVGPRQGVMQRLTLTLLPDGFDEESVYLDNGKPDATTLHFVRALPSEREVARIDRELEVRKLAPETFLVTHTAFVAANVLVARMRDGTVVLCSSPFETEATRALVKWVRSALLPDRVIAINTHFHFDGTGGNEAYRELGVTTYASDHTQRLLEEKGAAAQKEAAEGFEDAEQRRRVRAMKVISADDTFPERSGLVLTFGGEDVRVVYPGPGHSPDNVVVHFPSRGVLFGGCMIKGSRAVGNIGDADLSRWEASIEQARALRPTIVVPGHGAAAGPELFDLTASVVREARGASAK